MIINLKPCLILTDREMVSMGYNRIMAIGAEFDTENGEMNGDVARTVASYYQSSGSVGNVLCALASGCDVDREELSEDIAATGRAHGWPRELEYLATWCLNYGI